MRHSTTIRNPRVAMLRTIAFCLVTAVPVMMLGITEASARGGRAGGDRGSMARSSVSSVNRGNVNTRDVNRGNVNRGNVNTGNVNRGNINTGNVNRGNINTGNINTGDINRNVNVNVNNGYHGGYWGGGYYHPVARAAAIGAVAVTTAAVIGSMYYALPPTGCTTVIKKGVTYSHCGSVYYQQTWSGSDVVYAVVSP
ncbi:pentapeptide repeat-containing protein [Dokdonella sp.]|uniref:pentapeptide repeat-containing protein n=1 Tax=Dokdonella sp. TaxID=2291710 RepID=UPI0031C8ABA7|nr:pentapeptide repeat-containing protein [Dokdonella sp.]